MIETYVPPVRSSRRAAGSAGRSRDAATPHMTRAVHGDTLQLCPLLNISAGQPGGHRNFPTVATQKHHLEITMNHMYFYNIPIYMVINWYKTKVTDR